jgi:hypothetical protein
VLHFLDQALGVLFICFLGWLCLRPVISRIKAANARAEMERLDRLRSGVDPALADAIPDGSGDTLGAAAQRFGAWFVGGRLLELVVANHQRSAAVGRIGRKMTADLGSAGSCPTCGASAKSTIVVEGEGRCIDCQATWAIQDRC